MAMTISNPRRLARAASALMANPHVYNQMMNLASSAGRAVGGQAYQLAFPTAIQPTAPRMGPLSRPPRVRARRRRVRNAPRVRVSRGVGRGNIARDSLRNTFSFLVPVTTAGVTGIATGQFWLGFANTAATLGSMGSISTQFASIALVYQWMNFNSVRVRWTPEVAYTSAGTVAIGLNVDPTSPATVYPSLQSVLQKNVSYSTDIKEPREFFWIPENEQERESKELNNATGAVGGVLRNFAPGTILVYASSTLTAGATLLGYVEITADVTLNGLI